MDVIAGRVLELVCAAWDTRAFAQDLGDEGPPFVCDEERRAQLQAQLDAIYFHLYGIGRADAEYIMSTFPIVERKDRAAHGTYRTRDLILGYYDAYATAAPSALQTWLGPEEKRTARRHSGETRADLRGPTMVRLRNWLIIAGAAVAAAFAADRWRGAEFSVLSVLADAITVVGIVAVAIEFWIYVSERRPQARARQAVVDLADANPGKWAAAHEELVDLGGAALPALRPVSRLSFRRDEENIAQACYRAIAVTADIARDASDPESAVAAARALSDSAKRHAEVTFVLQSLFREAGDLPLDVAASVAVGMANGPYGAPKHFGDTFRRDHRVVEGMLALAGLVLMSDRVAAVPQVEAAANSTHKDVGACARFLLERERKTWAVDCLLKAVRAGELSLSSVAQEVLAAVAAESSKRTPDRSA